jgi:ribosomal protein S1
MNHEVVDAHNPDAEAQASGLEKNHGNSPSAAARGTTRNREGHESRVLPFAFRFRGEAGNTRAHAFKPGAFVAGKVVDVRLGVARVDLFGKAVAFLVDPELGKEWQTQLEAFEAKGHVAGDDVAESEIAPDGSSEVEASDVDDDHEVEAKDVELGTDEGTHEASDDSPDDSHEEALNAAEAVQAASLAERPPFVSPGDMVRGIVGAVAECGHVLLLPAAPGETQLIRAFLRDARQNRARVSGLVFGYNRGGFDVWMGGVRAFCPARGLCLDPIDDPHPLLGTWHSFHVQEVKSGKHRIVVSRRTILERERRKSAKKRFHELAPGQRVKARVIDVRDDSLRVEFEGIPGRIYYRELSWSSQQRPSDFAQVGDELEAEVLRIPDAVPGRKFRGPVELTLRPLQNDPWQNARDELVEGRAIKGKVLEVREPGAVIEVAEGIDAWLPAGEFPFLPTGINRRLVVGDEVHVVIERVDARRRRIALTSLAIHDIARFDSGELAAESESARGMSLRSGQRVKVRVEGADERGVRLRVVGILGRRGRAFMRPGDTNTRRGTDLKATFPLGSEYEAKIVVNDREGGILCSLRALEQDEERQALREFNSRGGNEGLGTLGDLFSKSSKKKK